MKLHNIVFHLILFIFNVSLHVVRPLCHDDERIAVLRLRDSFIVDNSCDSRAVSWNRLGDCCSWRGIGCDVETGHVVSLNLSKTCLYGSINSTSTLFHLSHLRILDLSNNHFNYSPIPPELGRLSNLTYINLASASFAGKIPTEISLLSDLSSLDLSNNDLSSQVPSFLANLTSLTRLQLANCQLHGKFPNEIFYLPKLELLVLTRNPNLSGSLPEFRLGCPIKKLVISNTSFSGIVPFSIENLNSLEYLSLARAKFSGSLPSTFGKLTNLTHLDFTSNNFSGPIPTFLQNLTKLTTLWFSTNQLTGQIPSWTGNLTSLTVLSFARNKLDGPIPSSLSQLTNLKTLNLYENNFSGTVDFEYMIRNMKQLAELRFDSNELSVITKPENNGNVTLGIKLEVLGLNFCNLGHFPGFLRYQDKLRYLDLGGNNIHGPIPKWIWNTSNGFMAYLALNNNLLTSIGDNEEVSSLFCKLNSLQLLDLSYNLLSGPMLPKCLATLNSSLAILSIRNNSFHGTIPELCLKNGSLLKMVDLSYNELIGEIPRSMRNCGALESLNLRNNQLVDIFPSWLGTLPNLRMLILQSNRLYGEISNPESDSQFPNLRVIDLSRNYFNGSLPSDFFQNWNAMKFVGSASNTYLKAKSSFEALQRTWYLEYAYSTTITIKGSSIRYGKIQDILVVIDFSGNKFQGEIPDSIANLKGLRILNLSNNILTGRIPSSFGSLPVLESLDLSGNQLSGEIPQSLVSLTFLAFFNLSDNDLEGRIPRGNQLDTFENSSYLGNVDLCGKPLSKKCVESQPPSEVEKEDSKSIFHEFNWITVVLGFGSGAAIGVVIENSFMAKRRELWILRTCWRGKLEERNEETETC